MRKKERFLLTILLILVLTGCGNHQSGNDSSDLSANSSSTGIDRDAPHTFAGYPVVYITSDLSAQGLLLAFQSLEAPTDEHFMIKLSDTEQDSDFSWEGLTEELSQSLQETTVKTTISETDFLDWDYAVILSHFGVHEQNGFSGTLEHMASLSEKSNITFVNTNKHLEELAVNAKGAVDKFEGDILYVAVLDETEFAGGGILSSYDPVALDQACVDLVQMSEKGQPFAAHIEACNGEYTLMYAEQIGLGSCTYAFLSIDS